MRRNKVLIVEDDPFIQEALKEFLESLSLEVMCANNGEQALNWLCNCQSTDSMNLSPLPDLILLDLMMPIIDGFTFRKIQMQDPLLSAIPVVVMSAQKDLENKKESLAVSEIIAKPFDIDQLQEI